MKRIILVWVLCTVSFTGFSQETNVYTFFLNIVNEDFKIPLIGFVNLANGNQKGFHLGFVNWNERNFAGVQLGMINTLGADLTGAQIAFINTAIQRVQGVQVGFINTAFREVRGGQIGYINTSKQAIRGLQCSFINTAIQAVDGAQIGYINTAFKEARGAQIGFINVANRKTSGFQLGFINFADTIENAVPIGFLSFVRRGGYFALEVGFSEFFPVTVGFKTGVERFYTTVYLAYQPSRASAKNVYASGFGFGSIIPLGKSVFFNPEIQSLNTIERKNNRQLTSFVPFFGVRFNNHFSLTAGPSVTWSNSFDDGVVLEPVFNISDFEIDRNNRIFVGARAAIRYRF